MIHFYAKFSLGKIKTYASMQFVPEFLAHTKLESVSLENQDLLRDSAPIHLIYTATGRVEDYYLSAEKHASSMISWLYENYLEENLPEGVIMSDVWKEAIPPLKFSRDENFPFWFWQDDSLWIPFVAREPQLQLQNSEMAPEGTYISLTRKQIIVSFSVLRDYMLAWLEKIGFTSLKAKSEVEWLSSDSAFILDAEPFSIKLVFDNMTGVMDLLHFAALEQTLASILPWGKLDLDISPELALQIKNESLIFHLDSNIQAD
ncbi:MAG: hypothetical protein Q4C96_09585 [Planctomycetia bacterium]|nr:hypothetical protein [Planctomycetia bacterium]